jgi:hypothetical protein
MDLRMEVDSCICSKRIVGTLKECSFSWADASPSQAQSSPSFTPLTGSSLPCSLVSIRLSTPLSGSALLQPSSTPWASRPGSAGRNRGSRFEDESLSPKSLRVAAGALFASPTHLRRVPGCAALPCIDSPPFNPRTRPRLRQRGLGRPAAWPPATLQLIDGIPKAGSKSRLAKSSLRQLHPLRSFRLFSLSDCKAHSNLPVLFTPCALNLVPWTLTMLSLYP